MENKTLYDGSTRQLKGQKETQRPLSNSYTVRNHQLLVKEVESLASKSAQI